MYAFYWVNLHSVYFTTRGPYYLHFTYLNELAFLYNRRWPNEWTIDLGRNVGSNISIWGGRNSDGRECERIPSGFATTRTPNTKETVEIKFERACFRGNPNFTC